MAGVLYERDGRIGRITLNRPGVLNAIDADMPRELVAAVEEADADAGVHVMLLSGAGRAFCAGYDRADHDDGPSGGSTVDTGAFLSLFRAMKPVVCKVHGVAVAGGGRHRALRRPHDHGRGGEDRIFAHAGTRMPDHGDVGASPGA